MTTVTSFYFAPTATTSWSLSMERFAEAATTRWPTSIATEEEFPAGRGRYIDFWNNEPRHDAMYEDDETLIYKRSTPVEAAPFVTWFLSLLPADARIRFSSEAAVEEGVGTTDWSLRRDADVHQVARALAAHLRDVYGEDVS